MRIACLVPAILLAGLAVPAPVFAQEPNCADPRTQADMNICAGIAYRKADGELNTAYKRALTYMKAIDSGLSENLKGAEKTLREAQRAWITYRDKACESDGFMARGGTLESYLVGSCLEKLTLARTEQLNVLADGLAN